MTQARIRTAVLTATLVLSATSARAQESAEVIDEKEGEVTSEDESSDDGGWSDEASDDNAGPGASAVHFGLRTGWGIPLGESASGVNLTDGIVGQIPIWLDLGWQATPKFMLGVYLSYGIVLLEDSTTTCPSGSSCSASDFRVGPQIQYSFSPHRPVDFWLGAGAGYEWASTKVDGQSATARGFEFLLLQLGLDFGGSEDSSTVFGPFLAYTFGRFDSIKLSGSRTSQTQDITDKAFHNWLFLGVRGVMK